MQSPGGSQNAAHLSGGQTHGSLINSTMTYITVSLTFLPEIRGGGSYGLYGTTTLVKFWGPGGASKAAQSAALP